LIFDIAIIGGGPAGLSVAKEIIQRSDAKMVMIEKNRQIGYPGKSCAFTSIETVQKYQLIKAVERYYSKASVYSFLGSKVTYEFNEPKLAVLNYTRTCQELLAKLRHKKIEIFTGTKAVGLSRKDKHLVVNLEGNFKGSIKCNLLIDASGASFFSARFTRFRIPQFYSHPYGYELHNCNIPNSYLQEISFFMGKSIGSGGGWFYPLSEEKCSFGIAEITNTPVYPLETLRQKYSFASRKMHPFCELIKNAQPVKGEFGTIPAEPMKKLVCNNIMRVGDSAGHATPHMLEGIRPSIDFGTMCGRVAVEAWKVGDFSRGFLERYEKMWKRQNKLLYLYLLSISEKVYSQNEFEIEHKIRTRARKRLDPQMYLDHVRGNFNFPLTLLHNIKRGRATNLARFVYHNVKWLLK